MDRARIGLDYIDMPYLFATQNLDYSDYSSGRVLYSQPGAPAFPVRLASEIFQRALHILGADRPGQERRLALFDPVCGGAYHLTTLGFLHGEWIDSITASDIDPETLSLAQRNIDLLSPNGIEHRITEILRMHSEYGKPSHLDALRSANILLHRLKQSNRTITARTFVASAFDSSALSHALSGLPIDLVFSDVPYGQLSAWCGLDGEEKAVPPIQRMLASLLPLLNHYTLLAIAADKHQKVACTGYRRVSHFGIGKREVTFLALAT